MSRLTRGEKLASFALTSSFIVLLLGTIIAAAMMPGNRLGNLSGNIVQTPRYDVQPNDLVYHGLFDKYKYASNGSTIADYRAVIESKILSTQDTSIDADSNPDLTILSELVLGDTDAGKIAIPSYIDLYSITSIAELVSIITGSSEIPKTILIPSFSAIHFVTSEGSVVLQKSIDILNEVATTGMMPSFTFDLDQLGNFPDHALNITTQDASNFIKVVNASSISDARHDCVQLSSDKKTGNAIILPDKAPISADIGTVAFHMKLGSTTRSHVEIVLDGGDTRAWIECINGTLKVVEGSYKWNGVDYVPASFIEYPIGYNITDTNWHLFVLDFNTYGHQFGLTVDPSFDIASSTFSDAFHNSSIPLSYFSTGPSYWNAWTFMANASTSKSSEAMTLYLDDIKYFTTAPDFLPILLNDLSFYDVSILPVNFNYDVIKDLFQTLNGYANALIHVTPFVIHDTTKELRITIPSTVTKSMQSLVELVLGSNFTSLEGAVDINITLCWDKRVALLNESIITLNYRDVGIIRSMGIELVATSKGGYPSSPDWTDYASIFQTIDDKIHVLTLTLWITGCGLGVLVTGILVIALIRYMRSPRHGRKH